ncbi:hypothetical protein [Natrinema halophilum]|uniref:Uncharacterized protein n=1 Tax=Natrinema halophilum TaxID=1699371 RepID=A0A7D5GTX2_9EURY|nr:hypothetical protein [Natrinema halophilum]QLG49646.1 hypothetical protein HYG82_12625 [Natrinema halophilum]
MSTDQPISEGVLLDLITIIQLTLGVLIPIAAIGWVHAILSTYFSPDEVRFYPQILLALIGLAAVGYLLSFLYE